MKARSMFMWCVFVVALLSVEGLASGDAASALKIAARVGNMAKLNQIIQHTGRGALNLNPAFVEASAHGRITAMRYLIAQGAENFQGALVSASVRNQIQAVRYLVDHDERVAHCDLRLARIAAGGAGATDVEFLLVTLIMHG